MAIHPGDILAGYRVTRLLGRGGMGEVWAAIGAGPGGVQREVAIKVLLARAAMKPDLVRRFEREAKIASAITSDYVCQLIEVGQAEDGSHLLVFEHLNGESLADRLKREQYLPFSEVGPIIEDVLRGLAAAHEAGVIHRDLKPGNIFLEQLADPAGDYAPPSGGFGTSPPPPRRERAKVLDFGISKISRREKEEPTLTAFDATLGSFAYMAPEQVRGAARADERADIYAVGAVAFRALSGRLPFEGTTAALLVALKLERQAPSLAEATGEHWPAGIERFLERALERRKEHRFASAAEALAAWRSISMQTPPYAEPAVDAVAPPPSVAGPVSEKPRSKPGSAPPPAVSRVVQLPPQAPPAAKPAVPPPPQQKLAPVRVKTPIPAPTKPIVTTAASAAARAPRMPSEHDLRPMARHGTLTMDELPEGTLLPVRVQEPVTPRPPSLPQINVPRGPMPSYQIVEDNPTEVDGPPEMTVDGSFQLPQTPPAEGAPSAHAYERPSPDAKNPKRNKTGRP